MLQCSQCSHKSNNIPQESSRNQQQQIVRLWFDCKHYNFHPCKRIISLSFHRRRRSLLCFSFKCFWSGNSSRANKRMRFLLQFNFSIFTAYNREIEKHFDFAMHTAMLSNCRSFSFICLCFLFPFKHSFIFEQRISCCCFCLKLSAVHFRWNAGNCRLAFVETYKRFGEFCTYNLSYTIWFPALLADPFLTLSHKTNQPNTSNIIQCPFHSLLSEIEFWNKAPRPLL